MSASGYHRIVRKVYLVEVKDARFSDGWYPMSVFLNKEVAEDSAAMFQYQRNDPDFARIVELRVTKTEGDVSNENN